MNDEGTSFSACLRHLAEKKRRSLTSHPTPQELAAYNAGELPPEAETRLLDHLAICRDCSDLLIDLTGFADLKPPKGVLELTDQQVEQDWQALRARMQAGEDRKERPAEVVPIRPAEPVPRLGRWASPWLPVAASLLAVLGFSFGLYQSMQVGRLSQPRIIPVIDGGEIERGGPSYPTISAREGGVIHFSPDPERDYPAYEAEMSCEGEVLFRTPVGSIEESAPLMIPGPLEPGICHARLYGVEEERRDLASDLVFRIDVP